MNSNPYYFHPVVQMIARAGVWPALWRPGDVFDGLIVSRWCLGSRHGRFGYLPILHVNGVLGFVEFDGIMFDPWTRQISRALKQNYVLEVHSSPLTLKVNWANLADATDLLRMAACYRDFLRIEPEGRRFNLGSLANEMPLRPPL